MGHGSFLFFSVLSYSVFCGAVNKGGSQKDFLNVSPFVRVGCIGREKSIESQIASGVQA